MDRKSRGSTFLAIAFALGVGAVGAEAIEGAKNYFFGDDNVQVSKLDEEFIVPDRERLEQP